MPTNIAVYPGTFDPVTNGHLDVIRRGAQLFGELVVACAVNISKQPLFSLSERLELLKSVTRGLKNVRVESFEGMVVDYVKGQGSRVILRGIRTFSDFEAEVQMALANRTFAPEVETVFVCASLEESFISSRLIREAAALDGDVGRFVPAEVLEALRGKKKALHAQVGSHKKGK
ncbi:MAG: pantetheine-phosphate adenylyltransferase [Planctomycetaceae bacterium]|nr:Phosphopantetheine adenylyltransferase [Planctomycetota bacterium]MCQ3948360.1 pantetheine-phosphate adenylyltransferase [Planctomycetota bacterium]NUO15718.1 pantetheine-phosphate adenylyltransferase [Planctomycetaceae bacterium]GIK52268.1 MAG: phosphopantetheine adenylyltransferase [Planctomycetota bacterium]HRJ77149.1 pantetheine-phosphate adenylyltransferase [Planctomycetota bacterium]